jgi:predicted nucleic acid-binding protein
MAGKPASGNRVLLDTGVLVALYARDDLYHFEAAQWMAGSHGDLHTVEPVLTEAAYFLPVRLRAAIATLAARGGVHLHYPDSAAYAHKPASRASPRSTWPTSASIAVMVASASSSSC